MLNRKNFTREWVFLLLILIINIILVSPRFMVSFDEINAFDEAKYIDSGRSLTLLEVRDISWAPLVALLYAPMHLVLRSNPDWFMLEAWVGRLVMYALIWMSTLFLASRLRKFAHPFITAGVLFTTVAIFPIFENQSDVLFIIISASALAVIYSILKNNRLRDIRIASVLLGLAVLARFEAILTLCAVALFILLLEWKRLPRLKVVASVLLPAIGVLLCYLVLYWSSIGRIKLEVGAKAWTAFENNQPILMEGSAPILTEGAGSGSSEETQRIFGTREENQGSVIKAISRNPFAFAQRVLINILHLPEYFLVFFGKRQGPIILLLALVGLQKLLREREFPFLMAIALWSIPAVISLGFLSRHFIPQMTPILLIFSALGLAAIYDISPRSIRKTAFLIILILFMIYALVDTKPAFLVAGFVFGAATLLILVLDIAAKPDQLGITTSFMFILAAGIILRGPYRFPDMPRIGESPREQVVHYLQESFPKGSKIFSRVPLTVLAAEMIDVHSRDIDIGTNIQSGEDLAAALQAEDINAIILDPIYPFSPGQINAYFEQGIGEYFELGFRDDSGTLKILILLDSIR